MDSFGVENVPVADLSVEEQLAVSLPDVLKLVHPKLPTGVVRREVDSFETPILAGSQEVQIAGFLHRPLGVGNLRHVIWNFWKIVGGQAHSADANDQRRGPPEILNTEFVPNHAVPFLYSGAQPRPFGINKAVGASQCGIGTLFCDIYGAVYLYRLPKDYAKGSYQRPCSNTLRPCYEFVPPLRFILAIVCLGGAVAINVYRRGWIRLLCVLPMFCTGWLILCGHKYWCEDDQREYESDPRLHGGTIVLQKYLDNLYSCSTVIGMANVLPKDKQIAVVSALAEGSSIRSIERMTGINRNTIMNLGVRVGKGCTALLDAKMRDLPCQLLQFDEVWGFIGKKERHCRPEDDPSYGDVRTFCAIDADTKLVPSFKCGKRDLATAKAFVEGVASRMRTRVQISTDALRAYADAIEQTYGADVDYGQIIKTYEHDDAQNAERKYSAARFVSVDKRAIAGRPNMDEVSTSYIERLNATTRLHMRRLTRLTHAFSKKFENFEAAVGLHFAYYNLVRRHGSLRMTPAMAAGIERDFWSVGDLVEAAA